MSFSQPRHSEESRRFRFSASVSASLSVACAGALAFVTMVVFVVGGCRTRTSSTATDAGATSTVQAQTPQPPASCEGPEFVFGDQDRLVWAANGVVRRRGRTFALEMKDELFFSSTKYGRIKTKDVTLVCSACSESEWNAFDAALDGLVGRLVRAKGIVHPAWSTSDGGAPKDGAGVQLDTRLPDVLAVDAGTAPPASR